MAPCRSIVPECAVRLQDATILLDKGELQMTAAEQSTTVHHANPLQQSTGSSTVHHTNPLQQSTGSSTVQQTNPLQQSTGSSTVQHTSPIQQSTGSSTVQHTSPIQQSATLQHSNPLSMSVRHANSFFGRSPPSTASEVSATSGDSSQSFDRCVSVLLLHVRQV